MPSYRKTAQNSDLIHAEDQSLSSAASLSVVQPGVPGFKPVRLKQHLGHQQARRVAEQIKQLMIDAPSNRVAYTVVGLTPTPQSMRYLI